MLKIKDNVDLKELEKFGFTYTNEYEQYYVLKENKDSAVDDCILVQERKITLRVDNNLVPLYEDYDLTKIYDLIKADLVEKI